MINMMYLVLTALLALNISKEVLRSFWEGVVAGQEVNSIITEKTDKVLKEFERDKEELLMFHDLSIRPGEPRRTIGWTSRLTDFIPWGGVLNRLREYHDLPLLGCEYDLGIMSVRCSDYPPKPRGSSLYKKSEDIGNRDIRIVLGDIGLWAAATIGLWFVLKK